MLSGSGRFGAVPPSRPRQQVACMGCRLSEVVTTAKQVAVITLSSVVTLGSVAAVRFPIVSTWKTVLSTETAVAQINGKLQQMKGDVTHIKSDVNLLTGQLSLLRNDMQEEAKRSGMLMQSIAAHIRRSPLLPEEGG